MVTKQELVDLFFEISVGTRSCRNAADVVLEMIEEAVSESNSEAIDVCREADKYLMTNNLTNIAHKSILHRKFQEISEKHKEGKENERKKRSE